MRPNEGSGLIDDGLWALEERVAECRRLWPEGKAENFEQLDRRGRRWRDKASGAEYFRVDGLPLLAVGGPTYESVSLWFVSAGKLLFLSRNDPRAPVSSVYQGGEVRSGVVGADGRVRWES